MALKSGTRELERLAGKRAFMALATFRLVIEACRGYAVNRVAMRADDMQHVAHVKSTLPDCQ